MVSRRNHTSDVLRFSGISNEAHIFAVNEESGLHAAGAEEVEELAGKEGVRAVVEG